MLRSGSILEEFSEKVKEYMRENMSTSAAKKKKKKKDKKKETEDQPSSTTHSSGKGSMFDKLDRPRSTAHKKQQQFLERQRTSPLCLSRGQLDL